MQKVLFLFSLFALTASAATEYVLFDGTSLDGWKSNEETPDAFSITEEGELKVSGGRAHLFWVGTEDIPAEFDDFLFKAKVKTTENSNSGLFFHTRYQEKGWPEHGLEAQVNTSHKDRRKTGSIYALKDVLDEAPSTDGVWFDYQIQVKGKNVKVWVDGELVNDYTEADPPITPPNRPHVHLSEGLFAIQGHDPKSTIYYKDITVRPLGE